MQGIIWTFETENFVVRYRAEPETDSPRGYFDGNPEHDAETVRKIESGYYDWFVAVVEVVKNGHVIGADYLGACCYENASDFCEGDHRNYYFRDMVRHAIKEARELSK